MGRNRLHNSGVLLTEVKASSPPHAPCSDKAYADDLGLEELYDDDISKLKASNKLY